MKSKIFLLFLLLVSLLFAEEDINNNAVKYGITTTKKGFLNYYIVENDKKINLLDSGTYLNSRIFIKDGDRRFYLRNSSEYVVKNDETTLTIKWRSENVEVLEIYKDNGYGYNYSIELKNRTDNIRNIGVYLIYDTFLGEDGGDHFIVDDYKVIDREKSYKSSEIPISVESKNSDGQSITFIFPEDLSLKPDELLLGNWEKLAYSKKWPAYISDGSLFSYGYYSINDSSLGIIYNGKNLKKDESFVYSFDLKIINNKPVKKVEEVKKENPKKWILNKDEEDETTTEIIEEEPVIETEEPVIMEEVVTEPEVVNNESKQEAIVNPEEEELKRMLEFIQKKKRGEDVSEYDFDEEYILEKLKETNE